MTAYLAATHSPQQILQCRRIKRKEPAQRVQRVRERPPDLCRAIVDQPAVVNGAAVLEHHPAVHGKYSHDARGVGQGCVHELQLGLQAGHRFGGDVAQSM